jgi:coenzyme PQQ synthesis protein D (PqqD)
MSKLYVARDARSAVRVLDGEAMVMSGRDSTLFSLNRTATLIWQAADGQTPLEEIVERRVCQEFEVEFTSALQDAENLARELAGHGILQISNEPISQLNPATGESR